MGTKLTQLVTSFKNRLIKFKFYNFKYKKLVGLMVVLVAVGLFVAPAIILAEGPQETGITNPNSLTTFDTIVGIFNRLLYVVAYGIGWIAMKIFSLLVVVAGWNHFLDNPAVQTGWFLVRDICNMFFVLILLVIAFAQILRVERYEIKKMLPAVIKAAILVNFSKLICGLIIDFGQVVMLTFVSGFQSTAGGNLIVGIGLDKIMKLNPGSQEAGQPPAGFEVTDITIALILAILLMVATIFVTGALCILLLLRMVMLWFLIVTSPAAFVLSTVPFGQKYAGDWWTKFGWNVAVGPLVAFFLWLSLLSMSYPEKMIQSMGNEYNAHERQTAGPEMGLLDNLAKAAVSLSLLAGCFMAAQQAGGMVGSFAGKAAAAGKKAAWGATKGVAMRAGGEKVQAAWQGFREQAATKKAIRTEGARRFGRAASAKVDQGIAAVKKAPAAVVGAGRVAVGAGFSPVKTAKGAAEAWKASKASGGGMLKNVAAAVGGAGAATGAKEKFLSTTRRFGKSNVIAAHAATEANKKSREDEANKVMAATLGDKAGDPAAVKVFLRMTGNKNEQQAALTALAGKGQLDQGDMGMVDKAFGKNETGKAAFMRTVKEKQPEAAYSGPRGEAKLKEDMRDGSFDPNKVPPKSLQDPEFTDKLIAAIREVKGDKALQVMVSKAANRGDNISTPINEAVTRMATKDIRAAQQVGATTEQINRGKEGQKLLADVSGDLAAAFADAASRDASGKVNVPDPKLQPGVSDYIRQANTRQLINIKVDSNTPVSVKQSLAENLRVSQLAKMATSSDSGPEQVTQIIQHMVTTNNVTRLSEIASNPKILEALDDTTRADVNKLTTSPTPSPPPPKSSGGKGKKGKKGKKRRP